MSNIATIRSLFERLLDKGEFTTRQVLTLLLIVEQGDKFSMRDAAINMNISVPGITRVVDALVDNNYVVRAHSRSDRRRIVLTATDLGVQFITHLVADTHS